MYRINTVLCFIKFNSNTIELIVHTSCYCVLDLLCVTKIVLKFVLTFSKKLAYYLTFSLLIRLPY